MAPKALANSSSERAEELGQRTGSADHAPVLRSCVAPRIAAASRHSRFSPSIAGVMIRTISGIWK